MRRSLIIIIYYKMKSILISLLLGFATATETENARAKPAEAWADAMKPGQVGYYDRNFMIALK